MSDVLSLTVELSSGAYPTKNREGKNSHRGGPKSDDYLELFGLVEAAARAEMERIGWTIATCECAGIIMRVVPKHWKSDAMNIGGCEANALTEAGVWTDDQACNPAIKYVRFDGDGPHRVVIVIVKLHQPVATEIKAIAKPHAAPKPQPKFKGDLVTGTTRERRAWRSGDAIPEGYANVNGELKTRAEAMKMIAGAK